MAARALWKASLQVGGADIAVKMYSAAQDRDTHFHLLHAEDMERVHERMRRSDDQQVVEHAASKSGYTLESGDVVLLDRSELAKLAPKPSREIELMHCVALDALPLSAFARPYWLGPDGDAETYFALAAALAEEPRLAICSWVLRGKQHFGALSARDGYLMLVELRSADQWLDVSSLHPPKADLNAREVTMAEQLIAGLEGELDHASFHDTYREEVEKLIAAKASGAKLPKPRAERRAAPSGSLSSALQASLKAMGGGKSTSTDKKGKTKSARTSTSHTERKSA